MSQTHKKKFVSLKQEESQTLSFENLQFMVGPKRSEQCKWLDYPELQKFTSIEDLMNKGAVVILLHIENKDYHTRGAVKPGHFILLLDHKDTYEHFDSYGLSLDEEANITGERYLTTLFQRTNKKYIDNGIKMQRFRDDINTCGRWVVARLLLRHLSLQDFMKEIKQLGRPDDETVTAMTLLLQFKC